MLVAKGKREKIVLSFFLISHSIIILTLGLAYLFALPWILGAITLTVLACLCMALQIDHPIRVLCILILSILFFGMIGIIIVPKYDNIPTIQDFYDVYGTKAYIITKDIPLVLSDTTAEIIIAPHRANGQQIRIVIDEKSTSTQTYNVRNEASIQFNASQPLYNTFVFVQFYSGDIVTIPTQSSRDIVYTQSGYITTLTGLMTEKIMLQAVGFIQQEKENIQHIYNAEKHAFFVAWGDGKRIDNAYTDGIIGYVLQTLNDIAPQYFAHNYENYRQFKNYIIENTNGGEVDRDSLFQQVDTTSLRDTIV